MGKRPDDDPSLGLDVSVGYTVKIVPVVSEKGEISFEILGVVILLMVLALMYLIGGSDTVMEYLTR